MYTYTLYRYDLDLIVTAPSVVYKVIMNGPDKEERYGWSELWPFTYLLYLYIDLFVFRIHLYTYNLHNSDPSLSPRLSQIHRHPCQAARPVLVRLDPGAVCATRDDHAHWVYRYIDICMCIYVYIRDMLNTLSWYNNTVRIIIYVFATFYYSHLIPSQSNHTPLTHIPLIYPYVCQALWWS